MNGDDDAGDDADDDAGDMYNGGDDTGNTGNTVNTLIFVSIYATLNSSKLCILKLSSLIKNLHESINSL